MKNEEFTELLWAQGRRLYRDMPWRRDTRPYYVLVSELMLQQTQVVRVIPKFESFIARFPDERALARAGLSEVLQAWQGLGYNRRAKYLHESARSITDTMDGVFPTESKDILSLPGVGKNTLGAIEAYAYNRPSLFIETNIRTVYIHHFFNDMWDIADSSLTTKLAETIDREHPREFYWALMDYGSWLKSNGVRNISQSRHYKKQSPLEGSIRQVRGAIIKELSASDHTLGSLTDAVLGDERYDLALKGLITDGLVQETNGRYHLTK